VAAKESAWKLGGLSIGQLGKRVWGQINDDEVLDRSAALSYYFVFALFPLMLFLFAMLGMVAGPGTQIRNELMSYLGRMLPGSASGLIDQVVNQTTQASGGGKLSFGILLALWSASAGVVAMMNGLNAVYEVRETRSFIKTRGIAVGLTIGLSVLVISALAIILYGGTIADWVGNMLHMGPAFTLAWKIVQWPLAVFFLVLSFALVYYFAPNVEQPHWAWLTPGALIGVVLWIVASVVFKLYLSFSNTYSATYGSIGAVIILMLWFYVSGLSLLIGGEINSEIEFAAAEHGDPQAKSRGQQNPQQSTRPAQRLPEKRPAA
jgi:membrane protein